MFHPCRIWIGIVSLSMAASASPLHADATLFLEDATMPSWSPDGNSIACVLIPTSGRPQIWLAPRGAMPSALTQDDNGAIWPVWLPDGERIVYERARGDFVVVNLQGQTQVEWPDPGVWDDIPPSLAPDGNLLYSTFSATHKLDLTTGATSAVAPAIGAAISPDGQWIAYSDANDSLVVGPVGGMPTQVLGFGGLPSWMPDSRHLVFLRFEGGEQTDLVLTNRDGSFQMDLTDDPETEWGPRVSPNGREVVYARSLGETLPIDLWILEIPPVSVTATTWTWVKRAFR